MINIRDFGVKGDGKADDTAALQHALEQGDGFVVLPRGEYRLSRPLVADLGKIGRFGITGSGGTARLIMTGPGPALFLKGTHNASADPSGFKPQIWERERMPTVSDLEIEGRHPEADGIKIVGVMQPTITGVLIRRVRHAVRVTERARNVLISHCHFYHNTGVGVFFDSVNLHQAIVTGSHISYCRLGGIRIEASEVRNFQITGNDIEYNNNRGHRIADADEVPTAEIYIDVGKGSIREGTIASNTIQATGSVNGANIRLIGRSAMENQKMGMWTISGNLIGSQDTNIHLTSVREVVISGNHIYSGRIRNVLVESSKNVVFGSNCIGHNPDYGAKEITTGVRFEDSTDCSISGTIIQGSQAEMTTVPAIKPVPREALLELVRCRRFSLNGVQLLDPAPYGISLEDCSEILISGCMVHDAREQKLMKRPIRWTGAGSSNFLTGCRLSYGTEGASELPSHVHAGENLNDKV